MALVKEFEKQQLDWWCSHYRISLRDLCTRTRQYLKGDIRIGVLEAFLTEIENKDEEREELV